MNYVSNCPKNFITFFNSKFNDNPFGDTRVVTFGQTGTVRRADRYRSRPSAGEAHLPKIIKCFRHI